MHVGSYDNKIPFGNSGISGLYSRLYNPLLVEIQCREVITQEDELLAFAEQ